MPAKKKQAPPPPPPGGLTGADLVLAKAAAEEQGAGKATDQATGDFIRLGGGGSYNHGFTGPPRAMAAYERQQAAQNQQAQAWQDEQAIEAELAKMDAEMAARRRKRNSQ
jgi:tRNA A37 N6-isopentenylltransferase MiaA